MSVPFQLTEDKGGRENILFQSYTIANLWQLMEFFEDAGKLYLAIVRLTHMLRSHDIGTVDPTQAVPLDDYLQMKERIDFVCAEFERIKFQYAFDCASELRQVIHNQIKEGKVSEPGIWMVLPPEVVYRYRSSVRDLANTFQRELSNRTVGFIPSERVGYYDGSKVLFSGEVLDKFGSLQYDMNQAGKCFAFGQYTACVFHLMRVLEIVLRQFAKKMRVRSQVFEKREWGAILNQINAKLKCESSDSARIRKRKDRLKVTAGFLNGVRMAWRNDTIHVRADYDEDGASKVMTSVRLFVEDFVRLPR